MDERVIVAGKKVTKPPWLTQKSVSLRKYIREMYSPRILDLLEESGEVHVDDRLVANLAKRISPISEVVVYLHRS